MKISQSLLYIFMIPFRNHVSNELIYGTFPSILSDTNAHVHLIEALIYSGTFYGYVSVAIKHFVCTSSIALKRAHFHVSKISFPFQITIFFLIIA